MSLKPEHHPAPFAIDEDMPKHSIAPSWPSLRIDLADIISKFEKLETELEYLRHGNLIHEVTMEGGIKITFDRIPREELIMAKLSEVYDVRDQLDKAQAAMAEKVAAIMAHDIGPKRRMLTSPMPAQRPRLKPVDPILDKMEADLIELAKVSHKQAVEQKDPKARPPSVKVAVPKEKKSFWRRQT